MPSRSITPKSKVYLFIKKCIKNKNISAIATATGIPEPWLYWLTSNTAKTGNYSVTRFEILYKFFTGKDLIDLKDADNLYKKNKKNLLQYKRK